MDDLVLTFSSGVLSGSGHDCIGDFALQGNYESNGSVSFVKQYTGKHAVTYQGLSTGEGVIYGHWRIPGFNTGRFALKPDGKSTDLPIRELTAADLAPRAAPPTPLPEPAVHRPHHAGVGGVHHGPAQRRFEERRETLMRKAGIPPAHTPPTTRPTRRLVPEEEAFFSREAIHASGKTFGGLARPVI